MHASIQVLFSWVRLSVDCPIQQTHRCLTLPLVFYLFRVGSTDGKTAIEIDGFQNVDGRQDGHPVVVRVQASS